jgi:hypothetical protein
MLGQNVWKCVLEGKVYVYKLFDYFSCRRQSLPDYRRKVDSNAKYIPGAEVVVGVTYGHPVRFCLPFDSRNPLPHLVAWPFG